MSKIIVCDLDGTLCNIDHRLHYVKQENPDWDSFFDACVDDTPNQWCVSIIEAMYAKGYGIVFVSGRSDKVAVKTRKWLIEKVGILNIAYDYELFMRPDGDHQPDDKLKEQIYEQHLKDRDTLFVLDDRKKVVDMWRSKGLTVLQCAEGEF